MKILFTIAGLHPESGGPARSVPELCVALALGGASIEIVSHHYGHRAAPPLTPRSELVRTTFAPCDSWLAHRLQWTPRFQTVLRDRCRNSGAQIIHDTGVWLSTNYAAACVSAELKLPRIVSPRGMLTAWSLRHKSWKKNLAWRLYQCRDLETAQVLHATSRAEAEDFRSAGLTQPVAVIPNGVDLPALQPPPQKRELRTLLFLSRIHPKKGLLDLVQALAQVRRDGWRVVIAGGDEMNYRAEVAAAIRAYKLESDFQFVGTVDGDAKWNLFRQADIFILPSHSENFGIVVAEALACGVPVIATRGTPWEGLITRRCGWWSDIGREGLASALREAMILPDDARREMGRRGRAWMEQDFSWTRVAGQMSLVYEWMIGQGAKPDCVIT